MGLALDRPNPRVGVAAVIVNGQRQVILGKRKGSHGSGKWAFPGGHLEFGESPASCAEREAWEETGLRVRAVKQVAVTNDVFADPDKHYITLFIVCKLEDKEEQPKLMEPDKCEGWSWKKWSEVQDSTKLEPDECFLPLVNLVRGHPDFEDQALCHVTPKMVWLW